MNFISKNLKKASYFNTTFVLVAIVLNLYSFVEGLYSTYAYVLCGCSIFGLLSALVYTTYGHKKENAAYYKLFMLLFFASCVLDIYEDVLSFSSPEFNGSMISSYANFARIIPLFLITFIKDFGEKRSKICSYIVFGLSLFMFVRALIVYNSILGYVVYTLSSVAMAAVTVILVNEKYVDKQARGAK